jgi:HEXXH motif-containing protein
MSGCGRQVVASHKPIVPKAEALGVLPCPSAASAARASLAYSTLDSIRVLFQRALELQLATEVELAASRRAFDLLLPDALEPEFYEWYFSAIALMRAGDLTSLPKHLRRLPSVCALPLIRAGLLDRERGDPLEIDLVDGRLILSERECPTVPAPRLEGSVQLQSYGHTVEARTTSGQSVQLDWMALDRFGHYLIPDCPIGFRQAGFALQRVATGFERELSSAYTIREPFRPIAPREFEETGLYSEYARRFSAGFSLIRRCWPELFDEICVLTNHVCLIRGTPFIGGSGVQCLGVTFLHLEPDWPDLCFPDHIVHEAAHQRLNVEFEVEPALTNENFIGAVSPIRRDPRPLHGILHGTFVFLRLAQFFERVMAVEPSLNAEQRFHRHVRGLYDGMAELDKHARWTPRGTSLFEAMWAVTSRLKTVLPKPDRRLYSQVGPDYMCAND